MLILMNTECGLLEFFHDLCVLGSERFGRRGSVGLNMAVSPFHTAR